MRPLLKINNLTNLQDARSSAAVGFDFISFSLERGSNKKLTPTLIWNMVNWLSGPEIVVEMNAESLEELNGLEKMFPFRYATFPVDDWNELLLTYTPSVILRGDEFCSPAHIQKWIDLAAKEEKEIKVELTLSKLNDIETYIDVFPHLFVHFSTVDLAEKCLQNSEVLPFGISLGEEVEEEPGALDYERIDSFMDVYQSRFEIGV